MLVLTRKLQEKITIGQEITITVLRVKGNSVRIGIEAPRSVHVVRGELARHDAQQDAPPATTFELGPPLSESNGPTRHVRGLAPLMREIEQRCRVSDSFLMTATIPAPAAAQ